MAHAPQTKIAATYMRGGTSKGVFFKLDDLPESARVPGAARDALLMRVIGSPDPYGKQTDGMGAATSSTSKTVIVSRSTQRGHDVDYLFGQVSIDSAFVDWSGNCGNLSAAVGPFAISSGLVDASRVPRNGVAVVRIWQANIGKTIVAHVPITEGAVQETGDFELDGVTFPAAEVQLEFIDPADEGDGEAGGALFPTGQLVDDLEGTSRKVLKFLEVPWDERVLRFDEHARSKSVASPSYAEVIKPVSKRAIGRWQNYRRHLEPYLHRLEPILKELGYTL